MRRADLGFGEGEFGGTELAEEVVDDPVAHGLGFAGELGGFLEEIAQLAVGDDHGGDGVGHLVLLHEAALLVEGALGAGGLDARFPLVVDLHGHEVGVGEVAVVVRHFLRAERLRGAGLAVVVARLLHEGAAGLHDSELAGDLVGDAVAHE